MSIPKSTHVGEFRSFDAFIKKYQIDDLGVSRLAVIVRGADTLRPSRVSLAS